MMKKNKKGQSTLEYAILIIIIIAALLSLQTYVKRGVQGRLKQSADDVGDQFSNTANYKKTTKTRSNTYSNSLHGVSESGKRADGIMTTNVETEMQMNAATK